VFVAQEQWEEAQHELGRRLPVLVARARLDEAQRRELEDEVAGLVADAVLEVVPGEHYRHLRDIAIRRVPRDQRDWPTVAAALALDASILTADADFLGCGVATWTVETLIAELQSG
jgi:predicted nucleic acid-binding protein